MNENDKLNGRLHGEQFEPDRPDSIGMRVLFTILIAMMVSVSQTVLGVLTVIQLVIMLVNKGEANRNLADFGTDLGVWIAKAARYMTAGSNVKPWPWSELD
ncbi:DUF4389 domain-containing protein [Marimonas arenosa]|uniref:DUF4389 domain-containing protein n=1 Tax=Marimonas arenosa TaxID=1795305 RepID=A0AAE4B7W6_9RHOB|nr:DUF4389 domain-containing protein [Marimonas arenosa]MDQ2091986.1 DUF4389 domain-containing protein [Marimonas arenosa]